jgi:hypothetical protein
VILVFPSLTVPVIQAALLAALLCLAAGASEPISPAAHKDDPAHKDGRVSAEDRQHWAFQPLTNPSLPAVKNAAWVRNPIDRFVLAKLEAQSWSPAAPAEPRALARRLFLDVTGLPPTPEECAAFLPELARSPQAVERLVDDLLARPAHGERWARHWLDLVRYAESNGYERDAAKPFAWRYRDYVIRAFNSDKPFDRFVIEQLSGDELPDDEVTAETLVATGIHRLGPWDDEPADPRQDRYDQLDDIVSTTSQVFLGLTLGCARCHDHKFEPLSMHDYYRMVAIFEPLTRPVSGRMELTVPIGRRTEIDAAAKTRKGSKAPDLPQGYYLLEQSSTPPASHVLLRGQASSPGPEVKPGVPAVLVASQPVFPPAAAPRSTSRRRLTLARWLADPANPLTARVIVNRVWQYHFGVGLVRTPSDFGIMGDPPSHPELLDWLTRWFIEHRWSLKALHRLILTSSTYRMRSQSDPKYAGADPENRLFWRFPYRRLEVEVIRDSMLAASGKLNRQMQGPSVFPAIPRAALDGSSDPATIWKPSDDVSASRRTVYTFVKRSLVVPMLEVLDFCDTTKSTARRNVTNVPTQALTLLNGDFVNSQARHLASRLVHDAGPDPDAEIERAWLLVLCRPPHPHERAAMRAFLDHESDALLRPAMQAQQELPAQDARSRALVQLCRALFNINEFVYPD